MKKLSFICAAFIIPLTSIAQSNQNEIELIQSLFGMEKIAAFEAFIELEGEAKDNFWTLYDQYEKERKSLGKNRIRLLTDYAYNYDRLTPEKTDELMSESIALRKKLDKLVFRYYGKIKTASGAEAAAQFYQLETYILSAVRLNILEEIPFIGELPN